MLRRFRPLPLSVRRTAPIRSEDEAALDAVAPGVVGEPSRLGPELSYVLLHCETRAEPTTTRPRDTEPLGWCGDGWTLLVYLGGRLGGSVRLDARGAGHDATPRVAQAVAVRVLGERGVEVTHWDPPEGTACFVAGHRPATHPHPASHPGTERGPDGRQLQVPGRSTGRHHEPAEA